MLNMRIQDDDNDTADKVLIDRIKALEGASIGSRVATIILGMLGAWFCRDTAQHNWIFTWQAVQSIFNLVSILITLRGRHIALTGFNVAARLRKSTVIPAINGLLWAVGINLMWVPGNFEMQLMVLFFILGIASGSLHTLKPHLPALFLFFIPCMGSILFATLWHHDAYTLIVFAGTATYMAWSSSQALTSHRELLNSLYEHHRIADLVIKLEKQKEIAESATLAKSRFLAAASHDMRQPMHALNLYLGVLGNFGLPANAYPVLNKVKECAQTMDEMFAVLLDISLLDASVKRANLSTFALSAVLNKVQLQFAQQAQNKGLILRVARCSTLVTTDAELLENILRNLVSNAIRYTDHGKILIGCRCTAQGIRVGVYDTGIGIAAEHQSDIFEEFYQVGNRERNREQGLGLGLAIVQRQARLLQAGLRLRSDIGRGTVFEIELNRSALAPALPKPVNNRTNPVRDLAGCLIVFVDDEAMILEAARLLLPQWGCEVIVADSGAQALAALADITRQPDAIICDHRLRNEETGVQVITALRNEFNCDIPAALITGDTSPEQIQAIAAASLPVLHKPLQSEVLREMLLDLVNQRIPA